MAAAASLEDVYLLRPLNQQPPTAEDKRHSDELEEVRRSLFLSYNLEGGDPLGVGEKLPEHASDCFGPIFPVQFLRSKDLVESLDEALLREEVLGLFYQLVQNWVKGICRRRNFSVEDARAHVYTFGSYRLGVHGPGKLNKGLCLRAPRCCRAPEGRSEV